MSAVIHIYAPKDVHQAPAIFTPWSLIHFAFGVFSHSIAVYSGNLLVGFLCFFTAHLLYEIKDIYFAYIAEQPKRKVNTFVNSVGDQFIACCGFLFAMTVFGNHNTLLNGILTMVLGFAILVLMLAVSKDTKLFNLWYGLG